MGIQNRDDYVTVRMPRNKLKLPVEGKVINPGRFPKFEKLITEFKYKPGYELTLVNPAVALIRDHETGLMLSPFNREDVARMAFLHLKCYIPDSTKFPHEDTLIQFQYSVDPHIEDTPDDYQLIYLKEMLRTFELHELDEWFRINGELVHNPHDDQGK